MVQAMDGSPEEKPLRPEASSAEAWVDVAVAKPLPRNVDYRSYGCAAAVMTTTAILLVPVGCLAYAWHDLSQPIGVVGPDRWPIALAENYADWQRGGANIDAIEVFATREDMLGGTAICKVRDKLETWEYFEKRCSRDLMESPEEARRRWEEVSGRYPGWAPALDDPKVEILPRSGKSDATMLRVARDPASDTIYIDYYFDF
jgi:hypothetical protein